MGLGGRSPFLRHLGPLTHLPSDSSSLQETAWRLELVTPRRAVRAELPEGVPAPWRPWPLPFFFIAYSISLFRSVAPCLVGKNN